MKRIKVQSQTITIADTTAAETIATQLVTLDSAFDKCVGIAILGQKNMTNVVGIGLRGSNGDIIDIVNKDLFTPSTGVNMNSRFMPINIPAKGFQYTIVTKPFVTIVEDCVFDVVFYLQNEE